MEEKIYLILNLINYNLLQDASTEKAVYWIDEVEVGLFNIELPASTIVEFNASQAAIQTSFIEYNTGLTLNNVII